MMNVVGCKVVQVCKVKLRGRMGVGVPGDKCPAQ